MMLARAQLLLLSRLGFQRTFAATSTPPLLMAVMLHAPSGHLFVEGRRHVEPPGRDESDGQTEAKTAGRASADLVADAGAEDEEHPTRGLIKSPLLQTKL